MPIAFVQDIGTVVADAVDSATGTFSSNTTTGNFVWTSVNVFTSGCPVATGSWTFINAVTETNAFASTCRIDYSNNITGGAGSTITYNPTGSNQYFSFGGCEYSGIVTSVSLDQIGQADSVSVSTAGATDTADELVVYTLGGDGSSDLGTLSASGYTTRWMEGDFNLHEGGLGCDKIVSVTGVQSATGTPTTSSPMSIIATFRGAAGGSPPPLMGRRTYVMP